MASVDPQEAPAQRPQTMLLDDSSLVVDGTIGTEIISQETIDCMSQPHVSGNKSFAGLISGAQPWYRRPSPWFMFPVVFVSASLFSSTAAPRNEIFISLACIYHAPTIPSEGTSPILHTAFSTLSTIAVTVPSPDRRCSTDPTILAAVARLVTVQSLVVGVLTCLTVGWWAQMSDRYGRKIILSMSVIGLLLSDANIIFVMGNKGEVPGGYWFLVVTSVIDGLFGGLSTGSAATYAYMADCVEPQARSHIFSLYMGTLFIGIAFGPTLGSILIKFTQNLLTPFYVSVTVYMLMIPLYLLALPESLILVARASLTRKQHELREEHAEAPQQARASGRWHARQRFLALFRFLSPLAIFLPRMIDGTGRRDWNLLLVVISNGILFSHFCLIAYKTQYAIAVFGWHSEELGYWLSAGGITRALHNIVILPIIIKFLKPGTPAVALPPQQNEMEPLISRNTSPEPWAEAEEGTPAATPTHPPTPSSYAIARTDLMIARVSLLIDIASYTMVAMSGGPVLFFVGTVAMSFGGGFGPAASSLALHLSNGQESGKLFGAIAVANTIGSSLVGPAIFGMIYINTVGTFPKAIFVAAAASVAVAFGAMLLIRLPQEPLSKDVEDRVGDELQPQTLGAI